MVTWRHPQNYIISRRPNISLKKDINLQYNKINTLHTAQIISVNKPTSLVITFLTYYEYHQMSAAVTWSAQIRFLAESGILISDMEFTLCSLSLFRPMLSLELALHSATTKSETLTFVILSSIGSEVLHPL